jgi:hypothetical protein
VICSTFDVKSLSPLGLQVKEVLTSDDATTGRKRDALKMLKELPMQERGYLWELLAKELPPTDYQIIHTHYIRYTLGYRWSK